ncbi:MAG: YbaY family lipoprotein, partial [Planctomycetia bacterium]
SASRAITGVLTTAQGVQVPSTAVITVRLLDITEPQWRDVALTQGQLPVARGFPVSYRLDPPAATPAHRYAVDARVEDGGRVLLQTVSPVAVPALDREQRIDLVLAQQAAPAANAVAPAAQIQQWIQSYLGRPPRPYETEVWLADLQQGKSLTDVQAGILSSSEYFERQRSNRDLYVTDVFRQLYGTAPTPAQLADLQARYDRVGGVRLQFVQQLLMQPR